jgi:hypothetical protein
MKITPVRVTRLMSKAAIQGSQFVSSLVVCDEGGVERRRGVRQEVAVLLSISLPHRSTAGHQFVVLEDCLDSIRLSGRPVDNIHKVANLNVLLLLIILAKGTTIVIMLIVFILVLFIVIVVFFGFLDKGHDESFAIESRVGEVHGNGSVGGILGNLNPDTAVNIVMLPRSGDLEGFEGRIDLIVATGSLAGSRSIPRLGARKDSGITGGLGTVVVIVVASIGSLLCDRINIRSGGIVQVVLGTLELSRHVLSVNRHATAGNGGSGEWGEWGGR